MGEYSDHVASKKHRKMKQQLATPTQPHLPGMVIKCPECSGITDQFLEKHCEGSFHTETMTRKMQLLGKTAWEKPASLQIPTKYPYTPRDPESPTSPLAIRMGMFGETGERDNDEGVPDLADFSTSEDTDADVVERKETENEARTHGMMNMVMDVHRQMGEMQIRMDRSNVRVSQLESSNIELSRRLRDIDGGHNGRYIDEPRVNAFASSYKDSPKKANNSKKMHRKKHRSPAPQMPRMTRQQIMSLDIVKQLMTSDPRMRAQVQYHLSQ